MEDVLALNLPHTKAIKFQSVRLYLHVSVLSKIMNHCGTHLLPNALQYARPALHNPYQSRSGSQLLWPVQPAPGPTAWNTWKEILSVMYLKPNSYQLSQPLGEWNADYDKDYRWVWWMCTHSNTLFHWHNSMWIAFNQYVRSLTNLKYKLYTSSTLVPQNTVPITPTILSNSINVPLLIMRISKPPEPVPTYVPLATCLSTPPEAWANPLWHDIHPHAHMDQLQTALHTDRKITVVSDAAVHNNRHAMCAWIIWAQQELWSGKGYVPGTTDEMYLGLAEAYGIATVLGFINHYLCIYPLTLDSNWPIYVYCDNQGIIDCINNHGGVPYPRDAAMDHRQLPCICRNSTANPTDEAYNSILLTRERPSRHQIR